MRRAPMVVVPGAAALATVVWSLLSTTRTVTPGGCAFIDGRSYCAMATGHLGYPPFSRRILVPWLVRVLGAGSVAGRFEAVQLAGLAASAAAVAVLAARGARALGGDLPARRGAAVLGGALCLLSPYATRLVVFTPVLVDQPANALGCGALVALTGRSWTALSRTGASRTGASRTAAFRTGWARAVAVVLGVAAVATRESWALPLVAAAAVSAPRERRGRWWATAFSGGCLAMALVGAALPYRGVQLSPVSVARTRIDAYTHLHALADLAYQLGHSVCLLPLAAAIGARLRPPGGAPAADALAPGPGGPGVCNPVPALCAAAAVHVAQAAVGGTNVGRIASAAIPLLAAAVAALSWTATRAARWAAGVALAATAVVWQPWQRLGGPDTGYGGHYYLQRGSQRPVVALAVAATLGTVAVWGRRRPRPLIRGR